LIVSRKLFSTRLIPPLIDQEISFILKHIGLVVKIVDQRAVQKAEELAAWLESKSYAVIRKESSPPSRGLPDESGSSAPPDLFCVFVLGGDGTFLSAVRWIGNQSIPILGVKFGDIGFLAEKAEENLFMAVEKVLRDEFTLEARMRLTVEVTRDNQPIAIETVLNDIVINKGTLARLANIQTYIDDHYLTTFRADGLIVSTPTGSTAYSLAAGGPVMHPDVPGMVLTPICPFTLTNRPLIVPDTATIQLKLEKSSEDIMLTFDGQAGIEINEMDTITVKKGPYPVSMITFADHQYFDVLKAKLRWSGGRV
jgi:NAD+ kinase